MDSKCKDPASASECALRRHSSKGGAVCSNPARTDLCGGRWASGVPTAKESWRDVASRVIGSASIELGAPSSQRNLYRWEQAPLSTEDSGALWRARLISNALFAAWVAVVLVCGLGFFMTSVARI